MKKMPSAFLLCLAILVSAAQSAFPQTLQRNREPEYRQGERITKFRDPMPSTVQEARSRDAARFL